MAHTSNHIGPKSLFSAQERMVAVSLVNNHHAAQSSVARVFGVTPSTVWQWRQNAHLAEVHTEPQPTPQDTSSAPKDVEAIRAENELLHRLLEYSVLCRKCGHTPFWSNILNAVQSGVNAN